MWGFHRRTDLRPSQSHLQFYETKKEITDRIRPHIRESIQIAQSMEQAQHYLSTIEQKSAPSTSETSNQEEQDSLSDLRLCN